MDVPHYRRLIYEDVYPGIDLVYFFNEQSQLTFEYHVGPGADPNQIELRYTDTDGMELRADGGAVARTPAGLLRLGRPLSYQERGNGREIVRSHFQIRGSDSFGVQFPLGYDSARKLVIDPTLQFSTYWGTGVSNNRTVAIDGAGNVYMSGGTMSNDWPTTDGSAHRGHFDVTVAKFDPNGKLLWSTLLGGPAEDYAYVSAVSANGELYVAGRAGEGFPTTPGAFDRTFHGGKGGGPHKPTDAFVVKLSPEGKLIYSTYIGGNGDEVARAIHLLPSGKLIVGGGNTTATDLPTGKGTRGGPVLKPKLGGIKDSWVAVVAADGKSLDFLTYFGPNDDRDMRGDETIRALGADAAGNIWIGGTTQGSDMIPTPDAFQKVRGRGSEAYIAKLSPDGKNLVYFSWLGGKGGDEIETEGVSDAAGNFYVAGSTGSSDFPVTPGAFQTTLKAKSAGWVAKVNSDGSLGFVTLYGGTSEEDDGVFFGPVVDPAGNVYCTGSFRADNISLTKDAFQRKRAGGYDAVLVAISPDGRRLLYGSYFGGSGNESGRHIGIHPNGSAVYIIGETESTDLPLLNASQTARSGSFLAKFSLAVRWWLQQ
jgi:hypothetical protein